MNKNKLIAALAMLTIGMAGLAGCSSKKESVKPDQSEAEKNLNKKKTEADIASQKTETINGEEMTIFEFKDGSSVITPGGDQTLDDVNKAIEDADKNGGGETKKIEAK